MKTSMVRLDWVNRRFVQDIEYGVEDGLPEGYTLFLEHTAHPADADEYGTVYKNGDWGCWGYSPQTLTLVHNYKKDGCICSKCTHLGTFDTNCLYWIDIYDGIILYSSAGSKYENFVLYNIYTKKQITVDYKFVSENDPDYVKLDEEYDHFYEPTLWRKDNLVFVEFEAFLGNIEPESDGHRFLCFDTDTFKLVPWSEAIETSGDVYEGIESRGEPKKYANGTFMRFFRRNLFPACFNNRYGKKEITTMCHETLHKEHKYKEFPKSLIKDMRKIRVLHAKETKQKIKPYSITPAHDSIWRKLAKFFERLDDKKRRKHWYKLEKISKKYEDRD